MTVPSPDMSATSIMMSSPESGQGVSSYSGMLYSVSPVFLTTSWSSQKINHLFFIIFFTSYFPPPHTESLFSSSHGKSLFLFTRCVSFLFTRIVSDGHGSFFSHGVSLFFSHGWSRTVTVLSFHTDGRGESRIFFFSLMATEK